jgi:hypothetical protein
MVRCAALTGLCLAVALVSLSAGDAQAGGATKHPRLHIALYELRKARVQLEEAGKKFGGHKAKALKAINAAVAEIEAGLTAIGENTKGIAPPEGSYKGYRNYPHIRHAIAALVEAREVLQKATHNFGGHRESAIRDIDVALVELRAAIKFAGG